MEVGSASAICHPSPDGDMPIQLTVGCALFGLDDQLIEEPPFFSLFKAGSWQLEGSTSKKVRWIWPVGHQNLTAGRF